MPAGPECPGGMENLVVEQDTKNARTLEEFKNRKYRYMLSSYSVEIERFVEHLENLHIEGASLEPSLLDRIRLSVGKSRLWPGRIRKRSTPGGRT